MTALSETSLFDLLERLAKGIVAVVGPHCEVIVHDFADLEHSVVIVAGDVTGRKPGAPVPDLAFVSEGSSPDAPDLLNYRAQVGDHFLQSSTVWLREPGGSLIGAICINVDYSNLVQAADLINKLAVAAQTPSDLVITDTFARDTQELIRLSTDNFLRREGRSDLESAPYETKLRLVQVLEDRGLFQVRGAVNEVAELLGITRASLYNYRLRLKQSESEVSRAT